MIYFSVFATAFIAATLLPAFSEVALAASLSTDAWVLGLWLAATVGNTLGSCVNWWLGREILRFQHWRWFPVRESQLKSAQQRFQKYGHWSLLLAWLPIIGDPLTFVAGALRVRFTLFLVLVALGKGLRYGVIVAAVAGVMP